MPTENKRITDLPPITTLPNSGVMNVVDTTDLTQSPSGSSFQMTKENYLKEVVDSIAVATSKASGTIIVPNSPAPAGTGVASWTATQAGTYTNYGGVVVNANSFAIISRSATGVFSISQTALDLTTYAKVADVNKINVWTAKVYASGDQVNYLGKDWVSNAATVAGDVPATSIKWTERLTAYAAKTDLTEYEKAVDTDGIKAQFKNGELFILDANENIAGKLSKTGVWSFGDISLRKLTAQTLDLVALTINNLVAEKINTPLFESDGSKIFIQDSNGNIGFIFDPLAKTPVFSNSLASSVIHITNYGQSLSVYTVSGAIVTTTTEAGIYTFNKGPIMEGFDADATRYDSLKLSTQTSYESPCGGMARMLKKAYITEKSYDVVANSQKILISAPGKGGQPILNLSKGTVHYNRFLETVTNGKRLANLEGSDYSHPFVYYKQGEDDWLTDNEVYKKRLIQLRNDLDADIKLIEPTNPDLFFICYQLGTSDLGGLNRSHIGIALAELCNENKYFFAGPPMYPLTHPDNVHLNPVSSVTSGAIAGYIGKQILEGKDWKGTKVNSTEFFNSTILLNYNVEKSPLVFDTTTVVNPTNYGFTLFDSLGVAKTITAVEILRGNTVKITCSAVIVKGDILRYAYKNGDTTKAGNTLGQRGNLRDSQGDTVKYDFNSQNIRLDNWAQAFEIKL
tara:strand:+ start:195 stop:2243 length:2049 start_codon:yes stop_codon:yes gene_type:complete